MPFKHLNEATLGKQSRRERLANLLLFLISVDSLRRLSAVITVDEWNNIEHVGRDGRIPQDAGKIS